MSGQEDDDYTYYVYEPNKNIIEGGIEYLIPQGDFGRKLNGNIICGNFSYFRQLNNSRFFIGTNVAFRTFDSFTIQERFADVNQTTKSSQFAMTLSSRVYPEIYFSIFEVFFEGGVGLNSAYTITNLYDIIAESTYNDYTEDRDYKLFMYGGTGIHIFLSEAIKLTPIFRTNFGPSFDYMVMKEKDTGYAESYQAFEFKSSIYNAITINLSLSIIF